MVKKNYEESVFRKWWFWLIIITIIGAISAI